MTKLISAPVDNLKLAMTHAIRRGLMSGQQYGYVAKRLLAEEQCTLLVFGLGHDAPLWFRSSRGRVAFVEDDPAFLTLAPATARVYLQKYPSRVGKWVAIPPPPRMIDRPWDFVFVDGPRGFHPQCPGRQIPIAWAKRLATKQVFVHDYERPWERELCDHLLGDPVERIQSVHPRRGELAVFDV